MDIFFHAAAGALVASLAGVRRRKRLGLAAFIGSLPDIPLGIAIALGVTPLAFGTTHSLTLTAGLFVVLAVALGWRVAIALPLHVMVDLPLHSYSVLYQLTPGYGLTWHVGYGWIAWLALWLALVGLTLRQAARLRTVAPVEEPILDPLADVVAEAMADAVGQEPHLAIETIEVKKEQRSGPRGEQES